jgi:hypothetical protein
MPKLKAPTISRTIGEYLYNNAGESILAWIIEGAQKVIALRLQYSRSGMCAESN